MTPKVQFIYQRIMYLMKGRNIDIRLHFVIDVITQERIKLEKISTLVNPIDILTKAIPINKFEQGLDLLNM